MVYITGDIHGSAEPLYDLFERYIRECIFILKITQKNAPLPDQRQRERASNS